MGDEDRRIAGRYRLVERIGSGSMGIVWRGLDEKLRRTVAVKQLLPHLLLTGGASSEAASSEAAERARREARIAARLHHPNAVTIYDVVEEDGLPWLIMEYVAARSLSTVLARQGSLPLRDVASIGTQIASALSEAHRAGVVHRDIKPGNVLLTDTGIAKLADFGISRATDDVVLTVTGLVSGTPAYLAPEVANGAPPTSASDVFALGATLYAAIEGQPPFGLNDNPLALLRAVAGGQIRPPTHAGPLAGVLTSLLRADPAERPLAAGVAADLAELARSVASTPVPTDSPSVAPAEPTTEISPPVETVGPWRTVTLAVVGGVAVVALVVAGVAGLTGGHDNAAPAAVAPSRHHGPTTTPAHKSAARPATNDVRGLITRYYALLPGHLTEAWQLLGLAYRAKVGGFGAFQGFYATIASVRVPAVTITGTHTAVATLVFTRKDGTTSTETYRFTVVERGGSLVIEDANLTTSR